MRLFRSNIKASIDKPYFYNIEKMHPYKMTNYLVISVSHLIFAFITIKFIIFLIFATGDYYVKLPRFFSVSAMLLLSTGFFTFRIKEAYKNDKLSSIRKFLSYTILIGLLFFLSQLFAWIEMLRKEDLSTVQDNVLNYMYLISVLHFLYVAGGMILAVILFYRIMTIEHDPVKSLIMLTNPFEKVLLEIFTSYWHFVGSVWLLFYFMLLFIF